jgi:hypothetical protein
MTLLDPDPPPLECESGSSSSQTDIKKEINLILNFPEMLFELSSYIRDRESIIKAASKIKLLVGPWSGQD